MQIITAGTPVSASSGQMPSAAARLLPAVYHELRALANTYLQTERSNHTLQPTGLVHEAFLRLSSEAADQEMPQQEFLALVAHVMRHVLVDHARRRQSQKRGGSWGRVALEALTGAHDDRNVDILTLENALARLGVRFPRCAQIVELRFFGGMTMVQVANMLGVSRKTATQDWLFARAWLSREMADDVS